MKKITNLELVEAGKCPGWLEFTGAAITGFGGGLLLTGATVTGGASAAIWVVGVGITIACAQ